jgi:hypothetical protein
MDPFQAYKDKIGTRIATIIGESLQELKITEDEAEEMGKYILDNIDLAKTESELFDFAKKLSEKWSIFNQILTSPDLTPSGQVQNPLPQPASVQENTDQIVHKTEDLLKENKLDEALQAVKSGTETPNENQPADVPANSPAGTGGAI